MTLDRRDLLRLGALGSVGAMSRRLAAFANSPSGASIEPDAKVLFVFDRGGNDGVNTVIPLGDADYPTARGNIAIPPGSTIPIPGSTYAALHPALTRLQTAMSTGSVAFLHAVGTDNPTRSHFVEMQKLETAEEAPATALKKEGFVPRLVEEARSGVLPTVAGVSVADQVQRMFRTTDPDRILTHIRSLQEYTFGSLAPNVRLKGAPPSAQLPDGEGLWGAASFQNPTDEIDRLIRGTGVNLCETELPLQAVSGLLYPSGHNAALYPTSPAEVTALGLPSGPERDALMSGQSYNFMRNMEEAVAILLNTPANAVGVDLGGFDTHQSQLPQHERLLHILGWALNSVYEDTIETGLLVVVMTEFGRTNEVNASDGTDHGVGTAFIAMGNGVNPGVYNCAATGSLQFGAPWIPLLTPPADPRYANAVTPQTHFQTVLAEICERHFGLAPAMVDAVIPGITSKIGRLYRRLGFLQ